MLLEPVRGAATQRLSLSRVGWFLAIAVYGLLAANLIVKAVTSNYDHEHYYFQAVSWLDGKLSIDNVPAYLQDVVTVNGHKYLPLGPLPAVLTLPLVAIFRDNYREYMLTFPLIALTMWVVWRILGKLNLTYHSTRLWMMVLFFGSTIYFSVALARNGAWFVAHVVTCLFLFLGINETLGRKRAMLMGLCLGLAATTRFTTIFTFPFFVVLLAVGESPETRRLAPLPDLIKRYLLFGVGVALPLAAYFGYNYVRFQSFFETGYNNSVLGGTGVLDQARAIGLFSLAHLPKNLYFFFLAMPEPYSAFRAANPAENPVLTFPFLRPSNWGLSIFLTTPAVIYAFRARLREPLVLACWLAIILAAIPIFAYYGVGWIQFGYRYALDFTPFLWLLIVIGLRDTEISLSRPNLALWLIILGCIVNLWGAYWLPIMRGIDRMPDFDHIAYMK